MKTQNKTHNIHTKVSEHDFVMLEAVCREYGFSSIYQLLQTLLRLFIRSMGKEYIESEEDGIAKEITDMFDELADSQREPRDYSCNPGGWNREE